MATKTEQLIKQAAKLFLKNGFERTTIADITKKLEMTSPSIYYYVKSKEGLFTLIFEQGQDIFQSEVIDKINKFDSAEDKIKTLIRNATRLLLTRPEVVLFVNGPPYWLSTKDRRRYRAQVKENNRFIRNLVNDLKVSENVEDSVDVTVAAYMLIGMNVWIRKWYNPRKRIKPGELADEISRVFLQGFCGRKVN